MFKRKITLKLYLIIAFSMIFLVGIAIVAQLFIVSRMNLTEYTKERVDVLNARMESMVSQYNKIPVTNDKQKYIDLLNEYEEQNSAYYYFIDNSYQIKYQSKEAGKLDKSYINNIIKRMRNNKESLKWGFDFRINGLFNLPSKYIAVCMPIYQTSNSDYAIGYAVAVTKEVYTNNNYLILRQYSFYLFILVILIASILGFVFSFIITRPILKIRDTAARMINLDFTEKCDYRANDEIGDLSNSINFLSEKLNDTIIQLKQANEGLKGDLDMQREIDQMRKEFIAAVSHEFKTPLTLIRGFNEMIIEKRLKEDELLEAQGIIMDEVDRMDKLVQELLDLSRLESITYELNQERFNCTEFLRMIGNKYSTMMEERNIIYNSELENKAVWVYADKSRIEQVVMNFITNAVIHTPENKTITLKAETQNGYIIVSVCNEGSHINESEIHKIWEKFYREDKSRSKKTGGTGLGLAICKQILEKHGSFYGVQNTDNGVRFYFMLEVKDS
ncbi:sensor histidine kinase [Anaeromicropila herbilytica]|uniref:histidine kinase n=1 Tax=Anaeromicropila herbilytica TaxID=2785025 RepID=A0A7R7EI59_9FIRM|nr:HAMP domain-containing sensor histidine kinase [Anaeromicropila herbilytica]BCN29217.1 two-component sensor histidine kinase [Anaeromicropila herbilytica]